jgi:hypothetical protein
MSTSLFGADVGGLRDTALAFHQGAQQLESICAWLQAPNRQCWIGPDALRFQQHVDQDLAQSLALVIEAMWQLRDSLRAHADEQELASQVGPGTAGHGGVLRSGSASSTPGRTSEVDPNDPNDVIDALFNLGDRVGEFDTMYDLAMLSEKLGKLGAVKLGAVSVLGLIGAGVTIHEGVQSDDKAVVASGSIDAALGTAGIVAAVAFPPAAPLIGGVALLKSLVDATIPYSQTSQDELWDYQADRMFGKPADQLTVQENDRLTKRYAGAPGVAFMLSDQMDKSVDEAVDSVRTVTKTVTGWFK